MWLYTMRPVIFLAFLSIFAPVVGIPLLVILLVTKTIPNQVRRTAQQQVLNTPNPSYDTYLASRNA